MKKSLLLLAIVAFTLTMSSCATIFNGPKQEVTVRSMTPDVTYYVNGEKVYLEGDVLKMKLKRSDSHSIIVKKEGYQTKTIEVNNQLQIGWAIYDAIALYPLLVDAPSGAWKEFEKTQYTIELEPTK
jgi:hypothetical protein